MEISQLTPSLSKMDSISNYIFEIRRLLIKNGFISNIYIENKEFLFLNFVKYYWNYKPNKEDIIILHASIGSKLTNFFKNLKCKKILIYHSHTPASFFEDIDEERFMLLKNYDDDLRSLSKSADYVLADSDFNKQDIEKLGFINIHTSPIFLNFKDRFKNDDSKILEKFDDDYINIICVGRIVPNKKIEDVIKVFYYYKKFINQKSRLFLIGSTSNVKIYHKNLLGYIKRLDLNDIYFTNKIRDSDLTSYYKFADLFVYMSEHEGIGLPLIEAMYFKIPIIAFNAAAVPYTLGNSGLLVNEKDHKRVAELINLVLNDSNLKKKILDGQEERLKYFDSERLQERFMQHILELKKSDNRLIHLQNRTEKLIDETEN